MAIGLGRSGLAHKLTIPVLAKAQWKSGLRLARPARLWLGPAQIYRKRRRVFGEGGQIWPADHLSRWPPARSGPAFSHRWLALPATNGHLGGHRIFFPFIFLKLSFFEYESSQFSISVWKQRKISLNYK